MSVNAISKSYFSISPCTPVSDVGNSLWVMYDECGSNRCVHITNRCLLAAACFSRSMTRGTMRGDAMSLFDSAMVPAPSFVHSAKPWLMPRSAVK